MTASLVDLRFVALLTIVAVVRPLVPQRAYLIFGALSSAALIGLASPPTLLCIVGLTLGYLYPLHLIGVRARAKSNDRSASQRWALAGVAGLAVLLIAFKAHRAFEIPLLSSGILNEQLLALVGVSYFFFRAVDFIYIQDVMELEKQTPWALLLYLLFPPTITSGPIQAYTDFKRQTDAPQPLNRSNLTTAIYRITRGYFRKIVLAYLLAEAVGGLVATQSPNAYTSMLIVAAFFVQSYFDFAGYSDIAIGFGLLLGIKVPENFLKPFRATSVGEFWRNWHITLMAWFRDHLFFPLGGARDRKKGAKLVLLVMLLCGLWHGFTWRFLAWGVSHGVMLSIEQVYPPRRFPPQLRNGWQFWSRVVWTNVRVALSMVFFLPDSAFEAVIAGVTKWL